MDARKGGIFLVVSVALLVSLAPYAVMGVVLGAPDLIYFCLIWLLFICCRWMVNKRFSMLPTLLAAAALSFPPVPNYLSFRKDGSVMIAFIGWSNSLDWGSFFLSLIFLLSFMLANAALNANKGA